MIVVTGATGKLGKLVIQNLLTRIQPSQLAVSVRDSSKASHLSAQEIKVTQATFDDPSTLREAFKGGDKLLLVSVDNFENAVKQHKTAIDIAKEVGIKTVFYTSHIGADINSPFLACQHHAETEEYLAQSGLEWYSLRNGFYSEGLPMMLHNPLESGAIYAPEDGPTCWTAHSDLAEATAILLTDDSRLPRNSHLIPLTASNAIEFKGIAKVLSEISGKDINRVVISDEQFVENTVKYGVPEFVANAILGIYKASRQGGFNKVDPLLEELLGKKPETIAEWAKRLYA
ncbi:hypothetical protein I302_103170 [Kwoniella bestiolae CBS 10118]|uniref:NmrA-like domain-containing protein n=1 Tax=Kwoniella bestiolae CBS 10118 TaxID=1296100 RepID=A0A1B9G7P7_9TREE|nr:hypothetical protein I302_01868 [Kwoniella bestiolae CBS 10118]OCF27033.1 hypothetical protein I302_01868 [Kwoniella bestiolae CBS 10118]